MTKTILVIGNGGRENAICDALARSPQTPRIVNFATSRNPGMVLLGAEIVITDSLENFDLLKKVVEDFKPDLSIIGPENPIEAGGADFLKDLGIPCFAPSAQCAQLESSKSFTRNLLKKYDIDCSPDFLVSTDVNDANRQSFFEKFEGQIVVKADGLLAGKGVIVAGDHFTTLNEAENFAKQSIEKFGRVVLEEKLIGQEFSLISLVDGETVLDTPAIQDHKRVNVGDTGPQTGGMGTISDERNSLPFLTAEDLTIAHDITERVMKAMEQELGEKFIGVMYGGFIVTKRGIKLIEYNARFGDPEALNILPILKTDFLDVCEKATQGRLSEIGKLEFQPVATVLKYLCANGYPTAPEKGAPITAPGKWNTNEAKTFFAGITVSSENTLLLSGGRAIGILGIGANLAEANENCEAMISQFEGPLFYRKDIGTAELVQKRIDDVENIKSS
jgi:phosphoribosylamine---glycine ligase